MALEPRWYIAPFRHNDGSLPGRPNSRHVVVRDLQEQIESEGGAWKFVPAQGRRCTDSGWAIVKVVAEPSTHALVGAVEGVRAIPPTYTDSQGQTRRTRRSTSMGDIPQSWRNQLRSIVLGNLGYDIDELTLVLGTLETATFGDLYNFLTDRCAISRFANGQWYHGVQPQGSADDLDDILPDPE